MLIINVDEKESIEKALRRYKKKVRDTKLLKDVRSRKHFEKPSVTRRAEILKAAYKEKKSNDLF